MKYTIQLQYKSDSASRPDNEGQDYSLIFEEEYPPIPNVGDSVQYIYNKQFVDRKVISRNFRYEVNDDINHIHVNIVVTDIDPMEMQKRINWPAQKWLKDRVGRVLSRSDMKHYNKIINALLTTHKIMGEIDEVL